MVHAHACFVCCCFRSVRRLVLVSALLALPYSFSISCFCWCSCHVSFCLFFWFFPLFVLLVVMIGVLFLLLCCYGRFCCLVVVLVVMCFGLCFFPPVFLSLSASLSLSLSLSLFYLLLASAYAQLTREKPQSLALSCDASIILDHLVWVGVVFWNHCCRSVCLYP